MPNDDGKKFVFHGKYTYKSQAVRRESEVPHSFIFEESHFGIKYYYVVTKKGRHNQHTARGKQ
jgi:hypothetical protein